MIERDAGAIQVIANAVYIVEEQCPGEHAMLAALAAGDKELRNEAIESLAPLIKYLARGWAKSHGRDDPRDCIGAGLLGLVVAIDRVLAGRCEHDGVKRYIVAVSVSHVRRFLDHDHLVAVPRKAKKKGVKAVPVVSIQADGTAPVERRCPNAARWLEMDDLLDVICECPDDWDIIHGRWDNETFGAIAKRVGRPGAYVSRRVASMRGRLISRYAQTG